MKVEHIAIWCRDLEKMKTFYCRYFSATSNEKYENPAKGFSSYFLSFNDGETRIELMHKPEVAEVLSDCLCEIGFAHLAISLGTKQKVKQLSEELRKDGYQVVGEPRTTGDGYYESVVRDCEGNLLELTE